MNNETLLYVNLTAIGLFLLKELYEFFRDSSKDHTRALEKNTIAIVKLEIQLRDLTHKIKMIEVIDRKVNHNEQAIKELKKRANLTTS